MLQLLLKIRPIVDSDEKGETEIFLVRNQNNLCYPDHLGQDERLE